MSSMCKRIKKPKKVCSRKIRQEMRRHCSVEYTKFVAFTSDGRNIEVSTPQPMTEVEAAAKYGWLSVSGIE